MTAIRELFREVGNLFRWWFLVAPWEQAVRVRAGKHVAVLGAGIHLRVPIIDRVFRQSTRRRFSTVPTQTVTTFDGRTVTVAGSVGYAIADVGRLYDTLHHAEEVIQSEVRGAIARFLASEGSDGAGPAEVEAHVAAVLDFTAYGLEGVEAFVTDFAAVKTYRLIQGGPRDWSIGDDLNTERDDTWTPPQ